AIARAPATAPMARTTTVPHRVAPAPGRTLRDGAARTTAKTDLSARRREHSDCNEAGGASAAGSRSPSPSLADDRKGKFEDGAALRWKIRDHAPSLRVHQRLDDEQPEAGGIGTVAAELAEPLEELGALLEGNPRPLIFDTQLHVAVVHGGFHQ